jgi:hypothetical protein
LLLGTFQKQLPQFVAMAMPINQLPQRFEGEAQQRFAIDGIIGAFGPFGFHVAPANVARPLSVPAAVHHRAATVGEIHDPARQRVARRVPGPGNAALMLAPFRDMTRAWETPCMR